MVLELVLNPENAAGRPVHIFFIAVLYTVVSSVIALRIFPGSASVLTISLITMLFIPFFQRMFSLEEKKEKAAAKRAALNLFSRHYGIFYAFSMFFLGVIFGMVLIYFFLPSEQLFSAQSETLKSFATGAQDGGVEFSRFFLNNTQVMLAMFLLSFAFGAGAIFILAWNASVIAVYLGLYTQSLAANGIGSSVAFVYGVPLGLSAIALHGIPEISAYFVAGLAGGLLSVGIIREKWNSPAFHLILKDSLLLLVLAEFLISAGAYIEAAL